MTREYVSNPMSFWVSGNETREFTFAPGRYAFHCRLPEKGYVRFNCLLFADSEEHVYEILRDLCRFEEACHNEYVRNEHPHLKHDELEAFRSHRRAKYQLLRDAVDARSMDVGRADLNQFFKIGWAHNDTL